MEDYDSKKLLKQGKELISLLEEYREWDRINDADILIRAARTVRRLKIEVESGLKLPKWWDGVGVVEVGRYSSIIRYGENAKLSWSDDGRHPNNECMYVICFSCGAYSLGDHYPTTSFNKMFNKLKELKPKYSDTANHNLLFELSRAKEVEGKLKEYFQEAYKESKKEKALSQLEEARKRLEELEKEAE